MRLLLSCLIIMLLHVLGSCQDTTEPPVLQHHRLRVLEPPTIIGSWNWIESETMFGIVTPATEGYTLKLHFDRDSNFYFYRNDTLLSVRKYRITQDSLSPCATDTCIALVFENPGGRSDTEQIIEFFGNDTLQLTDTGLDSGHSKYVRRPK